MILHKKHMMDYVPLYQTLVQEEENKKDNNPFSFIDLTASGKTNLFEKYSHMFQNLVSFQKQTESTSSISKITEILRTSLKQVLPVKDTALLFFDDENLNLTSISEKDSQNSIDALNHFWKEGVINVLFEMKKPLFIPQFQTYNSDGAKLNYLIFPIEEAGKKLGLLAILTTLSKNKLSDHDKYYIKMLLDLSLAKIEKHRIKEKLFSTYEELQTYQAKLSNDFRLAAIGELTEGVVEDIMTPMQVIMTQVDLLNSDKKNNDEAIKIKSQVRKINSVVERLVKFSSINQKEFRIQPCNLNELLIEYSELVKSTLSNARLEFVLDLYKNLPSILSHPNYLFQLLTNLLGLLKKNKSNTEGILIQTGFKNNNVILRIVSSVGLKTYNVNKCKITSSSDLSVRIINNLIYKHEAELKLEKIENNGAIILLKFPIKRKMRKL